MHRQDTVTYMFIYAMLNAVHTMKITHLNITERSLIQAVKVGKGISCQSILFKRGSISPSLTQSVSRHTVKEQEQEHSITMYKCIGTLKSKTDVYMLAYICSYVTCILIYHLMTQHAKNSHLNTATGSMIQVVGKGISN